MIIRISYKDQNGIKNTMHYYNIDRVKLGRTENGLPCLYLTTITGSVLERIVNNGLIEYATIEENHYWERNIKE